MSQKIETPEQLINRLMKEGPVMQLFVLHCVDAVSRVFVDNPDKVTAPPKVPARLWELCAVTAQNEIYKVYRKAKEDKATLQKAQ